MSGFASPSLAQNHAMQILESIAKGLRLVLTSPTRVDPGQPATAAVVPAAPEVDATDLADGALNLAWTATNVLLRDGGPVSIPSNGDMAGDDLLAAAAGAVVNNQPFVLGGEPFPPPLGTVTTPNIATATNIPGLLGQVFGAIAPPRIRVRVEVAWIVKDKDGNELAENDDFLAPQGVASPTVSLVFPPLVTEMSFAHLEREPVETRCLFARVTLHLGTVSLVEELGPVTIVVLPLVIPTVVVMFAEENFGLTVRGKAVIVVPKHSPMLAAEPLFKLLRKIETVVSALKNLRGFATMALGLDALLSSVPDQPRIRFVAADRIDYFTSIVLRRGRYVLGIKLKPKKTFNNRASSVLVFGLPGTRVRFYNDKNQQPGLGSFTLQVTAAFVAAVRTLHTPRTAPPEALPPASLVHHVLPPESGVNKKWHNALSSLRFETRRQPLGPVRPGDLLDARVVPLCGPVSKPPRGPLPTKPARR